MSTPLRAVVFDAGNTLWFQATQLPDAEVDGLQAQLLQPVLERWGLTLPFRLADVQREVWQAYDALWQREVRRGTYRELRIAEITRAALAERGIEISAECADEWHRTAWIGAAAFGVQLYPDTADVLAALRERGYLVGANSNRPCSADMFAHDLEQFGIGHLFHAVTCSGEAGYLKPHRATFDAIVAALGVQPDECLMVGDGLDADIRGAKVVGLRTAWKLNGRHDVEGEDDADFVVHDLNELLALPALGGAGVTAGSATPHDDGNADRY
jgi:putative hydrolase of the HAD superfamily